ncbi:MAG: hypothetical protein N3E49_05300 [Bacteroidia bacterium]|nr:hypothetical protein [Bacteroidia bacterium]
MIGLALIIGFLLLFRAYKLTLKHSDKLRRLEEENRYLRSEIEKLQAEYEEILRNPKAASSIIDERARFIEFLAERLEGRKEPLL